MFKKIQKTLDFCTWASDSRIGNSNFLLGEKTFKEETRYNQRMDYSAMETKSGRDNITFLSHMDVADAIDSFTAWYVYVGVLPLGNYYIPKQVRTRSLK